MGHRLGAAASTPAEVRARDDLASGDFLPGRGLLDMKAGLAAGIAAAERFAAEPQAGNLLFLAVPDEEASSAGARAAATELRAIATRHDLDFIGALNLDAIADDGDGSAGRAIAFGTIGKLLPAAFVVGQPTHSGFPQSGINAAVLAGAIARRVEWATELTDDAEGPATPPSLLGLRDGKAGYDVTTPASAFAYFNVLLVSRTPEDVMRSFDDLCGQAVAEVLADLRDRARKFRATDRAIEAVDAVPIIRFEALAEAAQRRDPASYAAARLAGAEATAVPLPELCRLATERMWAASGLAGPVVVTGFGSIPYLPTRLSRAPAALALASAARDAAAMVGHRHQTTIRCEPVFAGISDMSFLGEADDASLGIVARNTPVWGTAFVWPESGGIAGIPIINAGPWGRDYHTRLERLHAPYGFEVLPELLFAIVENTLNGQTDR